jgi:hypothetical protein
MKVNVTVELTRDEVLKAVTEAILDKHRYNYHHPLHSGTVLHIEQTGKDGGYFVEWGGGPAEVEPSPANAVEVVEAPTELEQIEMVNNPQSMEVL